MEENAQAAPPPPAPKPTGRFALAAAALCLVYLLIEITYATRMPLVMDEFNYASYVHDLKHRLPYRDFTPSKTVLGFYIQSIPLYLTSKPWTGLILIKCWMAVINTAVLLIGALLLARLYRPGAVLLALALLVPVSTFLERSCAVRVDTMTALAGFLSLLFLLRNRPVAAGVCCTLSFLVSQKGIYYVLAGNCALGLWFLANRGRNYRELLLFNATMLLTLLAYLAFWSLFAPFSSVWRDTFLQDRYFIMAFQYTHANIRDFWFQTLARNPLFYALGLAGLVLLAVRCMGGKLPHQAWLILVYLAAFAWIPLKQHSYPNEAAVIVLAVALAVAVLYAVNRGRILWLDWPLLLGAAIVGACLQSWTYGLAVAGVGMLWPLAQRDFHEPVRRTEWVLLAYAAAVGALCLWHKQPWPYFFVLLIPFVFVVQVSLFDQVLLWVSARPPQRAIQVGIFGIFLILGIGFPLTRFRHTLPRDNGFQRHMVELGTWLVQPGETYVDGTNMLYTVPQTVKALEWLGKLGHYELGLIEERGELPKVVEELERAPVKLVINSYRLPGIPEILAVHFKANFEHFWGNIYIYAPRVEPDQKQFQIKFSGRYRVAVPEGVTVLIDDEEFTSGSIVKLDKGLHANANSITFRLHFQPEGYEKVADPEHFAPSILYRNPYRY